VDVEITNESVLEAYPSASELIAARLQSAAADDPQLFSEGLSRVLDDIISNPFAIVNLVAALSDAGHRLARMVVGVDQHPLDALPLVELLTQSFAAVFQEED
jgi:hypothetical protein